MKANFFRGALAATCGVAMAGAVALAGPASAAPGPPDARVFEYYASAADEVNDVRSEVTLAQMCAYYVTPAVYQAIVDTEATSMVFPSLEELNDIEIVAGTNGSDQINGGSGDQMVLAFGGADAINTGRGNDYVCGGAGADAINTGSGDDEAFGDAAGNTNINEGRDVVNGGSGNDRLFGDGAKDTLNGGSDNDLLAGGTQTDTCSGGSGSNVLISCP